MDKKEYRLLLKDPRWQAKRLEILDRDNNTCSVCGCDDNLQVHHRVYEDIAPWEYKDEDLVTMCDGCHKDQHREHGNIYRSYVKSFDFMSEYIDDETGDICKTNSSVEITTSKNILSEIHNKRNNDPNLIFNSIDDIIKDISELSELQNSGRMKVNTKVSGDLDATIYINIFYKKKEIIIPKVKKEKSLTKKELAQKKSDEYFSALKAKKKAYSDKVKAEKAAKKLTKDITPKYE